jgi:hypothetical protein
MTLFLERPLLALAAAVALSACSSDPATPSASGGSSNTNAGTGGTPAAAGTGNTAGAAAGGGGATGGSGVGTSGSATGGSGAAGGSSSGGTTTGGAGGSPGVGGSGTSGGSAGGSSVALIVSDDFEAASGTTPDAAKWSVFNGDQSNAVAVSSEQAHSGTHSVKVDVKNAGAMLTTKVGLPTASGAVYFRAWARFSNGAAAAAAWQNHVTFIEAGGLLANGDVDQGDEARLGGQAGKIAANLSHGDGLSPSPWAMPCTPCADPPESAKWVCVEGLFDVSGQKVAAWLDGVQVVKADSQADWHAASTYPAALKRVGFGWEAYGSVANTVYYDDVAIGTERIGCN